MKKPNTANLEYLVRGRSMSIRQEADAKKELENLLEYVKYLEERPMIDWLKIDRENLPENEVLAACFEKGEYGYGEKIVGYLHQDGGAIVCENDGESLGYITHYIDIHKFDVKD